MRTMAIGALILALLPGILDAGEDEQVKWVKLDEARARSAATGKPVLVICMTDLVPDGPGTKGIDRSFTSESVRQQKDEFLFVKCCDLATVKAMKFTSKCELVTLDPDGDEVLRTVVKSTQEIANAMKETLVRYAPRPIAWSAEAPAPVERSPDGRRLTVVLFQAATDDVHATMRSLEDRSVAKLHPRCTFIAKAFRKDSPEVAAWNILNAPTLLILDAEKPFDPKNVVSRLSDKRTPREVKSFLKRGLAAVEKSNRPR